MPGSHGGCIVCAQQRHARSVLLRRKQQRGSRCSMVCTGDCRHLVTPQNVLEGSLVLQELELRLDTVVACIINSFRCCTCDCCRA
jgi:hypothetical protein